MRIVVAPDSFKGSATAEEAADAIARGWLAVRPDDEVVQLPQADGGEGTLAVLNAAIESSVIRSVGRLDGPNGTPVDGIWLELPDGTAVVELAAVCGLPLYARKDPLRASTYPLGEVLAAVVDQGASAVMVALGGSASTDGGAGALRALGLRLLDASGSELSLGGGGLSELVSIDATNLLRRPAGGVRLLTDVTAPLLGPAGAASIYGPQKGASRDDVERLERGLKTLAAALGGNPGAPGSGAAGGTAYGLVAAWGATISHGATAVAEVTGLTRQLSGADVLVTGEGQFDHTSLQGKVVGNALSIASPQLSQRFVIAGVVEVAPPNALTLSLSELAGSTAAAMASPVDWIERAGALAAELVARN